MKCTYHPDRDAVAMCVSCGAGLCPDCRNREEGKYYCDECLGKLRGLSMISVLTETGDAVIYTEPTDPTVRSGESNGYTLR